MPRIQSWAVTTTSSDADDAIVVSRDYFIELSSSYMFAGHGYELNEARQLTFPLAAADGVDGERRWRGK